MGISKPAVSVRDLQFCLYDRPIHPELFEIEHRQDVQERGYWSSIWLTNGGHVANFCWKKHFLVELLCPSYSPQGRNGILQKFPLRRERSCRQHTQEGLQYVMSGQVEQMSKKVFASVYDDFLVTAQSRGTLILRGDRNTPTAPFSYAEVDARQTELHVTTCHAFPDELAMAKTQSIFKAPGKVRRKRSAATKVRRGDIKEDEVAEEGTTSAAGY